MFTQLYEVVFPNLGEIFGKLSAIASMDFHDFLFKFFVAYQPLNYVNLFTGVADTFVPPSFADSAAITFIFSTVAALIKDFFPALASLPLWIVLLSGSCSVFFTIYIVKFVIDVIR